MAASTVDTVGRIAASAFPWLRGPQVTSATFEAALRQIAGLGFAAVLADLPSQMSTVRYRDLLHRHGLRPTAAVFRSALDETVDISDELARARAFARDQVELGMDRVVLSSVWVAARQAQPAVGADFNADRLELAIENCAILCQALLSEGLWPLHHSHVGGVFETETEVTRLLDQLGSDLIGVAADVGQLRWAGIDPVAFVARYADRVGAIHLKDCFPDLLDADHGLSYDDLQRTGRLWAEPGRGVVDVAGVLAAVPASFTGDYTIEIDVPSTGSLTDSFAAARTWLLKALREAEPLTPA